MRPLLLAICLLTQYRESAAQQVYLSGLYEISTYTYQSKTYDVFKFSRKGIKIKAKYFAKNAHSLTKDFFEDKVILFYCAGAYSNTWEVDSKPHGICVDNGFISNELIDNNIDGLVVVYNGGAELGGVGIVNLESDPVNTNAGKFYVRTKDEDKIKFLDWAHENGATVFQTHLMYSNNKYGFKLTNLTYGKLAARRFLLLCSDEVGSIIHLIINAQETDYLNRAAYAALEIAKSKKLTPIGMVNLDTGDKNIAYYNTSSGLVKLGTVDVEKATNLLIYYVDKTDNH